MHKLLLSFCLAVFLSGMGLCHAGTGGPVSLPDASGEVNGASGALDCEGWDRIASDHWNNRVQRLSWKYPDAPYFGDMPKEVQDFLVLKYCENGVDWVSNKKAVVRDLMEWKWPAGTVK